MWSRRNAFPLAELRDAACAPVAVTPSDHRRSAVDGLAEWDNMGESAMTAESKINFISALAYKLIPEVLREEAAMILSWVIGDAVGEESVGALTQVEYFFAGTDNGHLFMLPLLPPSMRPFVQRSRSPVAAARAAGSVPWNAGPRRLLHRHGREEPVLALATLGTLVASGGSDAHLHLSVFHPAPHHVVTISHPSPLRCLLMWEGSIFVERLVDPQQQYDVATSESSIAYAITGDESGVVRIWRVDIESRTYFLTAVFTIVTASGCLGFASPLHYLAREDVGRAKAEAERSDVIHCLAIDDNQRLLGGVKGGVVVWSLAELPWKKEEEDHILCWDDEQLRMEPAAVQRLRIRAERTTNISVWVKSASLLLECLQRDEDNDASVTGDHRVPAPSTSPAHPPQRSKWKPKYGTHAANGFDIGVVSNMVSLPSHNSSSNSAALFLRTVCLPLVFPSLKNTVHFPLWAVEPVFTPLDILPTAGSACYALLVLQHGKRIATSGSDGSVTVWVWDAAAKMYAKALSCGGGIGHRGLGRRVCLMRSPDIFISCGYDDGMVKEWHVYDEPELLMRCERRFTLLPANSYTIAPPVPTEEKGDEEVVSGVSCAVSFPEFHALFLVGAFESTIQTFSLSEVQGCSPPADYIYNGHKTVRVVLPRTADASRSSVGQSEG
ncbi:hypothetical protein DQ04_02241000 [Trypanosoma grayi]|uniref:hypothetical protein n=1 Tax=Trypanosoma grayi TaxID=71804 RepID=UPI0004F44EBF|nr:hypothetical protein DQ04_02241000 [Trypanosoma grayi]KEG11822.1 hypothetical protein DQ04_02241000 [Trypanosoma grayi]